MKPKATKNMSLGRGHGYWRRKAVDTIHTAGEVALVVLLELWSVKKLWSIVFPEQ